VEVDVLRRASAWTRHDWLAAAALTGAVACVPRPVRAQQRAVVRVASTVDDSLTPILYGVQSGLFGRYGLDVQLQGAASGGAIAASVVGGAVDIGKSSPLPLISAHLRGVPVQIVAGSALYLAEDPITALLVTKDSPIRTAADLNGRIAATPALQSLDQVATQAWVDQHGGNSETLKFVELPQPTVPAALAQGRIDAGTLVVPTLAEALSSGQFRILGRPFDAVAKRFLIAVWFSSRDYVARNADTLKRFDDAFAEAAAYVNAHHAETVAMLAAYAHLDPAVIAGMTRTTSALRLDPRDLQPLIDVAAKYKLIPKPFAAGEMIG
jgi:NitT/TauT family transport system substrate-binding protein